MRRRVVVAVVVIALVIGALVAFKTLRDRGSSFDEAMSAVPESTLRFSFTDWAEVRARLNLPTRQRASEAQAGALAQSAFDRDYAPASSIVDATPVLSGRFGFSAYNARWEGFAQSRKGAVMALKLQDADFDTIARNLEELGYQRPKGDEGVWVGGPDLMPQIDSSLTAQLQYVVLLAGKDLVLSSDSKTYLSSVTKVPLGDADSLRDLDSARELASRADPMTAVLWSRDFACSDLALSKGGTDTAAQGAKLVAAAGSVSPLSGFLLAMAPDRTLTVAGQFEDSDQAEKNLEPRAKLAVGPNPARDDSFSDEYDLTASKAIGSSVVLTMKPKDKSAFVLSTLYSGPLLLAAC